MHGGHSARELRRQAANGPPPLTVSWDTAKRTEVSNPGSSLNQLTVMDLHPAKTYHVRMFAANSVGRCGASNVLTVTTSEAGTATSCLTLPGVRGGDLSLSDGSCASLTPLLPPAPEGPPLDLQLEGLTPNSIRVTWRVR